MNWSEVDAHWVDIYKIYQCIDENGEAPLNDKMTIFAELESVQEEYKRKSDFILDWQNMTGYRISSKETRDTIIMYKTELFKLMGIHCKEYEGFTLKMGTMKNLLISRHSIYPKTDNSGSEFYYVTKPTTMNKLNPASEEFKIPGFDNESIY
jgi:hypothetical protein